MDDNGTYLGNIYGIYKACIANISIDIYDIKYKIITHTQAPPPSAAAPQWGGRPIGCLCVCDYFIFYIIDIYGYSSYIFLYSIYIYIYILNMFHIFSLVCFLIYSVNSRSGRDRSQSSGPISHVSGPELILCSNFIRFLHGFASRNPKTLFSNQKPKNNTKN